MDETFRTGSITILTVRSARSPPQRARPLDHAPPAGPGTPTAERRCSNHRQCGFESHPGYTRCSHTNTNHTDPQVVAHAGHPAELTCNLRSNSEVSSATCLERRTLDRLWVRIRVLPASRASSPLRQVRRPSHQRPRQADRPPSRCPSPPQTGPDPQPPTQATHEPLRPTVSAVALPRSRHAEPGSETSTRHNAHHHHHGNHPTPPEPYASTRPDHSRDHKRLTCGVRFGSCRVGRGTWQLTHPRCWPRRLSPVCT